MAVSQASIPSTLLLGVLVALTALGLAVGQLARGPVSGRFGHG